MGIGAFLFLGALALWRGSHRVGQEQGIRYRVTFITDYANDGYWGRAADGAISCAAKYGVDVKCLGSVQMDTDKLLQNLEGAIYAGVDGIITYGLRGSARFEELLKMANDAQIPLVLIDSDVTTSPRLCYVGTDNQASGYQAGLAMVKMLGEKGRILVSVSCRDKGNQFERLKGFEEAIVGYPQMEIARVVECGSDPVLAGSKLAMALEEEGDVTGIFCAEGVSSRACCHLMKKLGNQGERHVIVYDLSETQKEAVEKGWIDTCIQQDSRQMGERAMEILGEYLTGGEIPEEAVYTQTFFLTKTTMDQAEGADYGKAVVEWHYY